jgi:hypothetical protein
MIPKLIPFPITILAIKAELALRYPIWKNPAPKVQKVPMKSAIRRERVPMRLLK